MINIELFALASLTLAFLLSYYLIPKISDIIHFKHLMDNPNERSSHSQATSNLGGIAFFITLFLSFYFVDPFDDNNLMMSIIPGLIILFIIGLKDDLVILSPLSKLSFRLPYLRTP